MSSTPSKSPKRCCFFSDVQTYLRNIDITVAWRTSLCGSPASQPYLMYEAYDQTIQSNLTPGFKPFIYQIHTWYVEKEAVKINKKERKEKKTYTNVPWTAFEPRPFLIVYHAKKKRKRPWMKRHTQFEKESLTITQFFSQLPKFFPSTSVSVLAIPNPARQKDIFFQSRTRTCCLFKCSLTKNLWITWIISCDKFEN